MENMRPVQTDCEDDVWRAQPQASVSLQSVQHGTALDPRVLDAMLPYFTYYYGNPHSRTHQYGWESEAAMEEARTRVADLIGADSKEIVFTSGATESNNISVKGVARFYASKKRHVITTQTEHKCVLDSCRQMEAEGLEVTYLPVQENNLVDLELLESSIRPDTSLVSVMTLNNEIGVKIPLNVNKMNIDLMFISGHK